MIKSQDNLNTCNDGKRKSDVLIATIEKLEKTEEKLKIATNAIEQVLKEPQMMDAGMLMFLTVQLNKIKE